VFGAGDSQAHIGDPAGVADLLQALLMLSLLVVADATQ